MNTKKTIKKIDSYPLQVEMQKLTELVKYVVEQRDLLLQVESESLADFESQLNRATGFVNGNLSAQAMGKELEWDRLSSIEKMLSTVDLKDEDIDADGNFTKEFESLLNAKHTIYFTDDEMIINKKLETIIKSHNALSIDDRKKLIVNRSNELQINPFIRY
jgi:hypothetical protein|tara:strand:+ start:56 stop:538 length:483 start_codon:yes stop_codon:yes gene_type:complete